MRSTPALSLLILLLPPQLYAQPRPSGDQQPFALTHVTVIDATGASARRDMTVVVAAGRIAAIGMQKKVPIPKEARIIVAAGKFLIPGLWDMHAHLDDEEFDRSAYLPLFVANGVTGIRIMAGMPEHHRWRKEIESGGLLGPRMVIASRILAGPNSYVSDAVIVKNAAEAHEAVRKARQDGADFIKVHDLLPRDAYFAIAEESRRLGLPFAGHVPDAVTAAEASGAGQKSIEHLTGLDETKSDSGKAGALLALFKKNRTWQCPTLIMRHNYTILNDGHIADDPRLKYAKPAWRERWLDMTKQAGSTPVDEWIRRKELVRKEDHLVGEMQKAGVGILAGTDDINPFCIPGFSLHEELETLVKAGLTPMQALQTATRNPAKFLNKLNSLGTVERGKIADLVLLDADPLEDIHNTTRIHAIVIDGHLLNRKDLDQILAAVVAAAQKK